MKKLLIVFSGLLLCHCSHSEKRVHKTWAARKVAPKAVNKNESPQQASISKLKIAKKASSKQSALFKGGFLGPMSHVENHRAAVVGAHPQQMTGAKELSLDMRQLPLETNQNVQKWISYFQGRGSKRMKLYLERSSRYLPKMKEILRKHNLPEDLVYLALIESGFNAKANSHASAVGYWQFMKGTGRQYKLRSNYYVDERRDFIKSTEAAAKYLKALYNLFGSWYLAVASYNVGENRIKNLVMTHYTRDYWELVRKKLIPKETREYVPKFFAARLIAHNPAKYGFVGLNYHQPLSFQTIVSTKSVNLRTLAKKLSLPQKVVMDLNPAFKRKVATTYRGKVEVRVPKEVDRSMLVMALNKSLDNKKYRQSVASKNGVYKVRRGDTLSGIADKHKVRLSSLLRTNRLSKRSVIYPGKRLKLPSGSVSVHKKRRSKRKLIHIVKSGETLLHIANKYKVRMSKIINANSLRSKEKILAGNRLVIPR